MIDIVPEVRKAVYDHLRGEGLDVSVDSCLDDLVIGTNRVQLRVAVTIAIVLGKEEGGEE